MATLRSPETQKRYDEWKVAHSRNGRCVLCDREPVTPFTYWKIIHNDFPYDSVTQKHDMLVTLRHVVGTELNNEEKEEFEQIKKTYLGKHYESVLESLQSVMTIPSHFHLHLFSLKDDL